MSEKSALDVQLEELMASDCPHERTDMDEIPCRECTRAALAAAEARGSAMQKIQVDALGSQLLDVQRDCIAEKKRADAHEKVLEEIILLCMDVPRDGDDWRKLVADKARKARYGDPAWKTG
jgi:hypothetical protein